MKQITEDYVSYETAKLLNEKGFDAECCAFYVKSKECGIELFSVERRHNYNDNVYPRISAPTLQMAMKWLRKVYKLFIFISPWIMLEDSIQYYFEIREIKTSDFQTLYDYTSKELNSFEKVADAAIKYCLENLI